MSNRYSSLKNDHKALPLARKAVAINEELAVSQPDSFLDSLALCLMNLADRLYGLNRSSEALRYAREGVQKYQNIVHRMPGLSQGFAFALATLANCEDKCGNQQTALSANHKAIDVYSKPFFRSSVACHKDMNSMVQQYLKRCHRLRRQPDSRLLIPILNVMRQIQGGRG